MALDFISNSFRSKLAVLDLILWKLGRIFAAPAAQVKPSEVSGFNLGWVRFAFLASPLNLNPNPNPNLVPLQRAD
jgi:hypothetical protein